MTPDQQVRFDHAAHLAEVAAHLLLTGKPKSAVKVYIAGAAIAPTAEGEKQLLRMAAEILFGLYQSKTVH